MLQIDNHSDFVHPTNRRVRVVGQVLGVFLTRFCGLVKAVIGPELVSVKLKLFTCEKVRIGALTLCG